MSFTAWADGNSATLLPPSRFDTNLDQWFPADNPEPEPDPEEDDTPAPSAFDPAPATTPLPF